MQLKIACAYKDEDGMALALRLQGAGHAAFVQDAYLAHAWVRDFARGLAEFPASLASEARLATFDGKFALRAFVHDAVGHGALEIFLSREARPDVLPLHIRFSVPVEAAAINALGRQLQQWLDACDQPLVFEARMPADDADQNYF